MNRETKSKLKKHHADPYRSLVIQTRAVEQETLAAADYLKLVRENPSLIKSSQIAHPKVGKRNFGSFFVRYSRPVYKAIA